MYSHDKKPKSRLVFNMLGNVVIFPTTAKEEEAQAAQAIARSNPDQSQHLQTCPLEMPATMASGGKQMTVNTLLARLLRAVGAQQQLGRAPRGNLARAVKGKGKGKANR